MIQLIQLILQASEALAAHGVAAAARRAVAFEHELGQLTREGGQPRETDIWSLFPNCFPNCQFMLHQSITTQMNFV